MAHSPESAVYLRLRNISKHFGTLKAVDRITLDVGEHEFVCILGPSGCGKTTLLRIVAGLAGADEGEMLLGDRDLIQIPARLRGFGIVFQSYSLFPNMTVAENIGYGLSIQRKSRMAIQERVSELLALIEMT
ncbi:MAG: ATP-binding cassette domain-containing protein, partial [Deltaproteobacteria bacterium]|nr:ATP-binding cassette domain-containing protein [Deltaproteobacteria bacterium]